MFICRIDTDNDIYASNSYKFFDASGNFVYTVIAVTNDGITMINIYGMDTSAHKFLRSKNYMIFLLCSRLAEYYLKYIILSHEIMAISVQIVVGGNMFLKL